MEIVISQQVANWYKEELHLNAGDALRFFVRYGGFGGNIPGFSLGVNVENPKNPHKTISMSNISFFVEESDVWYFENNDLHVQFDEVLMEPSFLYVPKST